MLDYNILSSKKKVTIIKDDKPIEMVDLLSNTYKNYSNLDGKYIIVNKYYVARPDLISLACYGDDKYADVICKINGISNPFELNEDMLIFIPSLTEVSKLFIAGKPSSDILDSYLYSSKNKSNKQNRNYKSLKDKVDKNTESIGKRKINNQKYKNERRSPSEQVVTDKNYYIDRSLGLVIY